MMAGLLLARVATFAALRVAVPAVLAVLAVLFGQALRNAARQVRQAGRSADASLGRATRWVRHSSTDWEAPDARRARVPPTPPHRVRVAAPDDDAAEAEQEEQESTRARR
jgi:hypothetical protein